MAEVAPNSFADITERLDEIISVVRAQAPSLARSLGLYGAAIELGSRGAALVASFDLSPEEAAQLDQAARADDTSLDAAAQDGSDSASDAGADAAPPTE